MVVYKNGTDKVEEGTGRATNVVQLEISATTASPPSTRYHVIKYIGDHSRRAGTGHRAGDIKHTRLAAAEIRR